MTDSLEKRIGVFEAKFETHTAEEKEERAELLSVLKLLRAQIFGNGEIGLAERIRVLERVALTSKRLVWVGGVAIAGLVGSLLWEMLTWFIANRAIT